jgi:hypothetical protein
MTNLLRFKLARPREIPLLKHAGYEVLAPWDESFTLMALPAEVKLDLDRDAEHPAQAVEQLNAELVRPAE